MNILDDMGVNKLSGNFYSEENESFKTSTFPAFKTITINLKTT